jgi:hypothetical protein
MYEFREEHQILLVFISSFMLFNQQILMEYGMLKSYLYHVVVVSNIVVLVSSFIFQQQQPSAWQPGTTIST